MIIRCACTTGTAFKSGAANEPPGSRELFGIGPTSPSLASSSSLSSSPGRLKTSSWPLTNLRFFKGTSAAVLLPSPFPASPSFAAFARSPTLLSRSPVRRPASRSSWTTLQISLAGNFILPSAIPIHYCQASALLINCCCLASWCSSPCLTSISILPTGNTRTNNTGSTPIGHFLCVSCNSYLST